MTFNNSWQTDWSDQKHNTFFKCILISSTMANILFTGMNVTQCAHMNWKPFFRKSWCAHKSVSVQLLDDYDT